MSFIYGLVLEQGKYYVGRSDNAEERIAQHINEKGSSWTSHYKFVKVLFIKESTSCFDEEKYTKELMMLYGIENVRGASYATVVLDKTVKAQLQKEIWGAKDLCIRCGFEGHFVNECRKKLTVDGDKIEKKKKIIKKVKCEKCARGHLTSKCLASTKLDGTPIIITCQKCNRLGHNRKDCQN